MNLEQFLQKYPNVDVNDFMQTASNTVNAIQEVSEEITALNDQDALEELRRKMDSDPYEFGLVEPDDEPDYSFDYSDEEFDYNADELYVTASTSYSANETFYFMSDEHGVHGNHELGCSMAERWGNVHWNIPSRIDRGIEDEFPNHDVKLIKSYRIEPDAEYPWAVEKRVYKVTKRQ